MVLMAETVIKDNKDFYIIRSSMNDSVQLFFQYKRENKKKR